MNEQTKEKKYEKFIQPLSPRVSESVKPIESGLMKAFSIVSPVMIYILYVSLLTGAGQIILNKTADLSEDYARYISANKTVINACIRTAVIAIATGAQMPAFAGEKPRLYSDDGKLARTIRCILLGISASLMLNVLLALTGLTGSSKIYEKVAAKQFALSLPLGMLLYGLVAPIAEEVVFRGLVYNRMRRNGSSAAAAMLLSSAIFGLYHFNMVQAIYGILMGILIVWVYERYGGFIYPVLIHVAANTVVYLVSSVGYMNKIMTPVTIAVTGAIAVFQIILIGRENKS